MANTFDVSECSFVTGAPLSAESGWVVVSLDDLAEQDIENSGILKYTDGHFEGVCMKSFRSRAALWLPGRQEAFFVGDNGECAAIDPQGGIHDEYLTASQRSPRNTGHIRAATRLGDEVIAVGMQRQAYRRDAHGTWHDMMQGLPAGSSEGVSGFECVVALSPNEIYAAGWRGELWIFEGQAWRRIDSPTNLVITTMGLDPEGNVLAGGRNGLLLSGRHDSWQIVREGACPTDLYAIDGSTGKVFVAGLRHLFELTEDGAELLDIDAESFGEFIHGEGVLWSMGQKDFMSFDGTTWKRIY